MTHRLSKEATKEITAFVISKALPRLLEEMRANKKDRTAATVRSS